MKAFCQKIILLLFLLFPLGLNAQTKYNDPWSFLKLLNNDIKEVSCYKFEANKKGKIKKDSSIIYNYTIDKTKNRLFGSSSPFEVMASNGKFIQQNSGEYIENTYDSLGNLVKEIWMPNEVIPKKKHGSIKIDSLWNITAYTYNNKNNLQEKQIQTISKSYSISKNTKYTFLSETIDYQIYSTEFDQYFKQIKQYLYNSSDNLKYLNEEWIYNKMNLLSQFISYTETGSYCTKQYYYYDNKNRLIKQIDSTGWINKNPYIEKMIDYEYFQNGDYKETYHSYMQLDTTKTWSVIYNRNNLPVKKIDELSRVFAIYEYETNKLTKEIYYTGNQAIGREITYVYTDTGLMLSRHKINFIDPGLSELTKYYYK